jgi:hypothetical protein
MSLSEEVCKTQALEKRTASQCRSPSASLCKPQLGNVPKVGLEVFNMESLAEQRIHEACLRRLCAKHKGQYS